MRRSWVLLLAVPVVALALVVPAALADDGLVRTTWPSADDPGPPFYARIEPSPPHALTDGEWAAMVFYRDPECVQLEGFNLLNFFDPGPAFGCPLTVEGSSLWIGEPLVGAPKIANIRGTGAVPVWFAPLGSFEAAAQDSVLTIGEVAGLDGLIMGTASRYSETLHPESLPPEFGGGGHQIPKQRITAHGQLEDGRSFFLQFSEVTEMTKAIHIVFR